MIYAVYATWAERGPTGWQPRRKRLGEVTAANAAEAERLARADWPDATRNRGVAVERRR